MRKRFPLPGRRLPIDFGDEPVCLLPIRVLPPRRRRNSVRLCHPPSYRRADISAFRKRGFTLVEILVVLALLSLIVFALMAVFSSTQRAFRASITQTDTLEGGRAVMDLIAADLESLTPSDGYNDTNPLSFGTTVPVNFQASVKNFGLQPYPPTPLLQPLIGSPTGIMRTNVLEDIFILSKGNLNGVPSWIATGYSVNTNLADGTLYPLYRFYMTTNAASGFAGQLNLYYAWSFFQYTNSASWSHLMDGVIHLTARAYDTNGVWMTNGYSKPVNLPVRNVSFIQSTNGEVGCLFFSNAVPASVQVEMGSLEDRTLAHAESLTGAAQANYLGNSSGLLHIFDKRVWIRNLDLSAYQ
jgi:prepilin-type N-terminal cleavage/methylation domain-containing protein